LLVMVATMANTRPREDQTRSMPADDRRRKAVGLMRPAGECALTFGGDHGSARAECWGCGLGGADRPYGLAGGVAGGGGHHATAEPYRDGSMAVAVHRDAVVLQLCGWPRGGCASVAGPCRPRRAGAGGLSSSRAAVLRACEGRGAFDRLGHCAAAVEFPSGQIARARGGYRRACCCQNAGYSACFLDHSAARSPCWSRATPGTVRSSSTGRRRDRSTSYLMVGDMSDGSG